ncbi:MAG: adenylate/guanylate cyclase domain-containing protein [Colwellia sp.]|nr:adenylate/guanylate cyclase domain-containing protein [Colwellia sp.]
MSEFHTMLSEFFCLKEQSTKSKIEEDIWKKYGVHGYVMLMDMSEFSLVTQRYGIVYYLSMIEKMKAVVRPIIESNSGSLVKYVADNVYARFDNASDAIDAAVEINETLDAINKSTPAEWDICVATGIDYGRFLKTEDGDIFGDAVNCASKFGEDIAQRNEIIISKRAFEHIDNPGKYQAKFVRFKVSGISLEAYTIKPLLVNIC